MKPSGGRSTLRAALALPSLLLAMSTSARALATPSPTDPADAITLTFSPHDTPPVPFAATALGRATHQVHVNATNTALVRAPFAARGLRFEARRDGVGYPCDTDVSGTRSPANLDAGATVGFDLGVTCDTPLVGRYDVELIGGGVAEPHAFTVTIGGGTNAPVRASWEPRWWAAASATPQIAPGPASTVRVVVALINGSKNTTKLTPFLVRLRTRARASGERACPEQEVAIEPTGDLSPGRAHTVWLALRCPLSAEGLYDVEVFAEGRGRAAQQVAVLAVRVRSGPLPPPPAPTNAPLFPAVSRPANVQPVGRLETERLRRPSGLDGPGVARGELS